MAEDRKALLLRLPPERWEQVRELAWQNRTSVTVEINRAVDQYVATQPVESAVRSTATGRG